MTPAKFQAVLNYRIDKIKKVLDSKAQEYASNNDRLHNFNLAAQVNNTTPAKALWGMATKHLVSVMDLVSGNTRPTTDLINEKIGDMINYLILLEAILLESCSEPCEKELRKEEMNGMIQPPQGYAAKYVLNNNSKPYPNE